MVHESTVGLHVPKTEADPYTHHPHSQMITPVSLVCVSAKVIKN